VPDAGYLEIQVGTGKLLIRFIQKKRFKIVRVYFCP
jgi:hypothetical protein